MTGFVTTILQPSVAQWLLKAEGASVYLLTLFLFLFFKPAKNSSWAHVNFHHLQHPWQGAPQFSWKDHFCKPNPFAFIEPFTYQPSLVFHSSSLGRDGELVVNVHTVFCRKVHLSRPESAHIKCLFARTDVRILAGETLEHLQRRTLDCLVCMTGRRDGITCSYCKWVQWIVSCC